jgi:hypothetical protein
MAMPTAMKSTPPAASPAMMNGNMSIRSALH